MFVINDGGSHHLSAAKYVATRIQQPVEMSAPLHYYALDAHAVAALRSEYDVYVVSYESEVSNLFFAAMESAGATWFWRGMPEPYWGGDLPATRRTPDAECIPGLPSGWLRGAGRAFGRDCQPRHSGGHHQVHGA